MKAAMAGLREDPRGGDALRLRDYDYKGTALASGSLLGHCLP